MTKRVVELAEYWPTLFSSRSIKTQKRTGPVSSHLNHTSLVSKGFITGIWQKRGPFLAGPTRDIPSGQDWSTLPAWLANQNTRFAISLYLACTRIQPFNKLEYLLSLKESESAIKGCYSIKGENNWRSFIASRAFWCIVRRLQWIRPFWIPCIGKQKPYRELVSCRGCGALGEYRWCFCTPEQYGQPAKLRCGVQACGTSSGLFNSQWRLPCPSWLEYLQIRYM